MKDVSQCLLSIIDEFEKYHSKIVSLEDANQSYDKNVKTLKTSRDKLLRSKKEESKILLQEHSKLQGRYKYSKIVIEELRDENAHMNTDILHLKNENEEYKDLIQILKEELEISKKNEVKEPKNIGHLFSKLENLKAELVLSKQELSTLSTVQAENIQLKLQYEEAVHEKLQDSSKQYTLHEEYAKIKKEKKHACEKIEHLEFEYKGLNKLYQNSLHEKVLLKKKAEDLILEKYNKMYEPKHTFGIDINTARGQSNYIDIDSLIEDIDSKPPIQIKAPA